MLFWFIVALMVLLSLGIIVLRLLTEIRSTGNVKESTALALYKQRLLELDRDLDDGLVTAEEITVLKRDAELILLEDVNADGATEVHAADQGHRDWKAVAIVTVLVPVLSLGMYSYLGQPGIMEALQTAPAIDPDGSRDEQLAAIEQMVDNLATRMLNNPDDIEGWTMLARSYKVLRRFQESAMAYEHVYSRTPDDAGIILQYADALAMINNGLLSGRPEELILQALGIEPENIMGRWMAGMAAREKGDFHGALEYWQRLLPELDNDPESYQQLRQMIQTVSQEMEGSSNDIQPDTRAQTGSETESGTEGIRVRVSLAESLQENINPGDVLFVFARAIQGPPMPLAAARLSAGDLPAEIVLNDSMAMMSGLKLSAYDSVQVNARISRSGNVTAASGDLEATAKTAMPGQELAVDLLIDSVIE